MKTSFSSFEDLPVMLNADQLARALNISRAGAYQLMHSSSFPTVRIGKRMLVPKEHLLRWLDQKVQEK